MRKVILFLHVWLLVACTLHAQKIDWKVDSRISWQKIYETTNAAFNAYGLWTLDEDILLIEDLAIQKTPLRAYNIESDTIINEIQSGRGPGEIHPTFYKRVTKFMNGNILLWDSGNQKATIYDQNLSYQGNLSGDIFNQRLYQVGLINDSTLFVSGSKKDRFEIIRLSNDKADEANIIATINFDEYQELYGLNNFMHRQAIYLTNDGERIYLSFEFSSVVTGISEKGIEFITSAPGNINLPEFDENSPTYSLPKMGDHPEGSRFIAVNDRFVFSLFSGVPVSKWQQIRYASNFDYLIDKSKHTKRLLIYNKKTGSFISETDLPTASKFIAVVGNNIFYLANSLGNETILYKYIAAK